jgi:hypothetical protein
VIAETSALDPRQYAVQYELLRSQVTEARGDLTSAGATRQPHGVGLALLLREGMSGWLTAIEAVIRASLASRTTQAVEPPVPLHVAGGNETPSWLSNIKRHDITTLLASLVLSTRTLQRSSQTEGYQTCR